MLFFLKEAPIMWSASRWHWSGWVLTCATLLMSSTTALSQEVEYYHLDAVGNVIALSDSNGQVVETHDYLPFGEEWSAQPGKQPLRFTGKERDIETGLDYFGARYDSAMVGRFTTTDPVYNLKESLVDPQRWNRYAYGRNNPLRYVDPDGRDIIVLVWRPGGDGVGHSAIAVQDRNARGRPTGEVTVYHLWPAVPVGMSRRAPADYRAERHSEADLASFQGGEGRGPDGIVRIKGNPRQDKAASDALAAVRGGNSAYVAPSNTCSTYCKTGVEAAGIPVEQTGRVTVSRYGVILAEEDGVVTPVAVYNSVVDSRSPRVEVVKPLSSRNPDLHIR